MMNFFKKAATVSFFLLCVLLTTVSVYAADSGKYAVTETEGEYSLFDANVLEGEPIFKSTSMSEIIAEAGENADITFTDVIISENLVISGGNYSFGGKIKFSPQGGITLDGGSLRLSEIELSLSNPIRVKRGELLFSSGKINAYDSAVLLDYSSMAKFSMSGGIIASSSDKPTLHVQYGTASIGGGRLENSVGVAIDTKSTLILYGDSEIVGGKYGVLTDLPITLSENGQAFHGSLDIKYLSKFAEGSITPTVYATDENTLDSVRLYDIDGARQELEYFDFYSGIDEKFFGAVYLPYSVNFYSDGAICETQLKLRGEHVDIPTHSDKEGYEFDGWRLGSAIGEFFEFSAAVEGNTNIYAAYKLIPIGYELSSLYFEYDASIHQLKPDKIFHPRLDEGIVSYRWYKDGAEIGVYSEAVSVKNVSDSGFYSCLITFSLDGESTKTQTCEVEVSVKKCEIAIPTPSPVYYNGREQYPDVKSCALYTVEDKCGILAGVYPLKITLCDSENYKFESSDDNTAYSDFIILRADNEWNETLVIPDTYTGMIPSPYAAPLYGEVRYLYSADLKMGFFDEIPTEAGEYYVKAVVDGNENYTALESEAVPFCIIRECVVGLTVINGPARDRYVAFDKFDPTGVTVGVSYNSARSETVSASGFAIIYNSANELHYGDNLVMLEYGGFYVSISVTVTTAEYDLSGIVFSDSTVEYDGKKKTLSFGGELPTGLDGKKLFAEVVGGGTDVGNYNLKLVFSSESKEYVIPTPMSATLTVIPKEVEVCWYDTSFVYDGGVKLPTAYYLDVYGRKIMLEVNGGHSYAGEYTASASVKDTNYALKNGECPFTVAKAEYDMSGAYWSIKDVLYDGTEKRVDILNLPEGVSVIGYLDNRGINAGTYKAIVSLGYDEHNYNPPVLPSYEWKIIPREYELDSFSFSDGVFVYDGKEHFPTLIGDMPVGIDGITLEYHFGAGVVNVIDGKKEVKISFSTKSKNYVVPEDCYFYVTVTPKPITVKWGNLEFVYSGEAFMPTAFADECNVQVSGEATDAGEYTAFCISLDKNYSVENSAADFKILKAENGWIKEPLCENVYFGKAPSIYAESKGGIVHYLFYTDSECKNKVDLPTEVGVYYVVAVSNGGNNYTEITSDVLSFEILKVLPTGISITMNKDKFLAFDTVLPSDFSLVVQNNDGSSYNADAELVDIRYHGGDCFYFGDESVLFKYGEFEQEVKIAVDKRSFDISNAQWEGIRHIYDGTSKSAYLVGLPEEIKIVSYVGNGGKTAGEYTVSVLVEYDTNNYYPPEIPSALLRIEKQRITLPDIAPLEYSGVVVAPQIPESSLYTFTCQEALSAGEYYIEFVLTDSDNYVFESGDKKATAVFTVKKRPIKIQVDDITKYLFFNDENVAPSYKIVEGELVYGDSLNCEFIISDDEISAVFFESNYDIEVIPGKIVKVRQLSEDGRERLILIILIFLVGILVLVAVIINKKRLYNYYREALCRADGSSDNPVPKEPQGNKSPNVEKAVDREKLTDEIEEKEETDAVSDCCEEKSANVEKSENILDQPDHIAHVSIDAGYADSAISDSLARNLLRKDECVYTSGYKRGIVNVDTLSRSFDEGERVDVNILKEKSLIPYDTAYIKVLARGIIDKPLTVYANDFSLSAVKMIALAGGKAIKVKTVIGKERKNT